MDTGSTIKNISFSYEALGSSSYLVATLDEGFGPVNYQMEMLSANEIANILPASKHQNNADIKIYYNATSKVPLSQAISRQKMSKDNFLNLLLGAINAFKEVNEYQLVNTGIVLDPEFIFIKMGSFEPSFVYLPIFTADEGIARLREFIVNLILKDSIQVSNDNFVQILLSRISSDTLSLAELEKILVDFKHSTTSGGQKSSSIPQQVIETPVRQSPQYIPNNEPAPSVIATSPAQPINTNIPAGIPTKKSRTEKKEKEPKKEPAEGKKLDSKLLVKISMQAVFLIIFVALLSSGALKSAAGGLDPTKAFGALIAIGGIDFVVYRELFVNREEAKTGKEKSDKKKADKKSKAPAPEKGFSIPGIKPAAPAQAPIQQAAPNPIFSQPAPQPLPVQPVQMPISNVNITTDSDDTVILTENSTGTAYLEFYENGISNKIPLDKPSTVIGRLRGQVDYVVNNNKVGKIHAEFISRNGQYFVKDFNSTNGTYINGSGQRIISNVEHQINDNDRICLANSEFVLKC